MATKYQHSSGTIVEVVYTFRVTLEGNYVNCTAYIDSDAQYHVATTTDFNSAFTIYEPTYEYQVLAIRDNTASILAEWATEEEVAIANTAFKVRIYTIIPETKRIRA